MELSKEEIYFSWMLDELKHEGFINSWKRADTYKLGEPLYHDYYEILKTKTNNKHQKLLNGCEYTPDFEITWNQKAEDIFYTTIKTGKKVNLNLFIANSYTRQCWIETKGDYDFKQMNTLAAVNKKWIFEKYKIFVNLVKVPSIFVEKFVPERFLLTDKARGIRNIKFEVKTLSEYLKSLEIVEESKEIEEQGIKKVQLWS